MLNITELSADLLKLSEQKRSLEYQMEAIKDELADVLKKEGVAEMVIPSNEEGFVFHIKTNVRFTKKFDKEGLAIAIRRSKDELDYHGISSLVSQQKLAPAQVAEFQSDSQSNFISVRRKKAEGGKK